MELLAGPPLHHLNMIPRCQGYRYIIKAVKQLSAELAYFISSRTQREILAADAFHLVHITGNEIQLTLKKLKTYKKNLS